MNSVFLFDKYKQKYFFSFLGAGFCPKNLAFARKMMVLPESGGAAAPPSPPGSYAYGGHCELTCDRYTMGKGTALLVL